MRRLLFVYVATILSFWAAAVSATDRYASTSGSGSTCSSGTPCSIATAIGNSVAGNADRVLMLSGTYGDLSTNTQSFPSGTSFANALTIMAAPGNTVHVASIGINSGAKRYIIFQDLTVDYPQAAPEVLEPINVGGGENEGTGSGFIRFTNIISLNGEVNISRGSVGGVEVIGGKFSTAAFYPSPDTRLDGSNRHISPHCFYISAPNVIVRGAEITHCAQSGIQVYDDGGSNAPNNAQIIGNWIHDTGVASNASVNYPSFAITVDFGGSAKVFYNVIARATNGIAFSSNNNLVYNNIFYLNTDPTSACCFSTIYGSRGSGDQVINNLLIGNSLNNVDVSAVSGVTTATNRTGDSAVSTFVNTATDDLSLKAGASAIDSGTTSTSSISLSCAGSCDVGAYEVPKFASCSITGNTLSITFDNPRFPPLSNIATTGITATVDGTSRSLTSPTLVGTNQVNLTTSGAAAASTASTVGSSVAITDSASIGGLTANVQKAANWSSTPCTVTGGGGGSALLTQTHFRLHDLPGTESAPKCLSSSGSCTGMEGVNATVQKGGCFRCRAKISCTGAACATAGYIFRFSKNGGGYTVVPDSFDSNNIKFYGTADTSSEIPTQGTVTTALLTSDFGVGTPVTDAFTNLTNFTGSYTTYANMAITAGRARSATLNTSAIESHNTSIGLNQYAQVVLSTFNTAASYIEGGVILRASNSPTATFYYIVASHGLSSTTFIYRIVAGVEELVAQDASQTWAASDTIKAKMEGSNISVYRNGSTTAFMTYTDGAPLTGTKSGAVIFAADALSDVELDSFEAGQTNTGTVVSGAFIRTSNAIPSITSPPQNSEWEIEGALCIDNDETVGTTYDFKLYNQNGTALDTYSAIPRVTVAAPALVGGISSATGLGIGGAACTQVTSTSQNCVTTIGWQPSAVDATHSMPTNYLIRRADGGGAMAKIGSVAAANTSLQNTFTDNGGVDHCYDVTATVTGASSSLPSNQICWTSPPLTPTAPPVAPSAPQNFTVSYRPMRKAA